VLYLIVFLGANIGGALRHGINVGAARLFGYGFPVGTLIVNIAGSFLIGLFAGYFAFRPGIGQHMRLFLTTGLLGGFTTFSAFSLDAALLIERHSYAAAADYVAGSVFAGLVALFVGLALFERRIPLP
jgi:fluoride exporter